jgi:hypothetical protein
VFARVGNDYRYNGVRGKDETLCNTKSRQKQEKLQRTQVDRKRGAPSERSRGNATPKNNCK